jgi:hypothetical protein
MAEQQRPLRILGEHSPSSGLLREFYQGADLEQEEQLEPLISMTSIFAVQTLGMQLRETARTTLRKGNGKHGFSMLENVNTDEHAVYDGSTEEYMSFRIAKLHHDQWRMRVSFRQNELSEQTKKESHIDDYFFDWLRNGNRMAVYTNRHKDASSNGTVNVIGERHLITDNEAKELQERMIVHAAMSRLNDERIEQ